MHVVNAYCDDDDDDTTRLHFVNDDINDEHLDAHIHG